MQNKKSAANSKENEQQWCMFEGPVRTKSKLTNPSKWH